MHINTLSKKLIKVSSSFKIIKHYVPQICKKQLYFAYIYSRLAYGIEVYGHTSKGNFKQLQVLQNKVLKSLFNFDWYTPTNVLHSNLNLLNLTDIFHVSLLKLVYKQRNNLLPNVFNDYFITRSNITYM